MSIVNYLQIDSRWANIDYSAPGEKTTIGKAGCGPTCAAMVIASLADSSVTPKETAAWSLKNGYKAKNQGTYYSYFKPQMAAYGIKAYQVNGSNIYGKPSDAAHNEVIKAIKAGNLVIACMGKGNWTSSGHFVLLYNIVDGYAYINDPNSTASCRVKNTWDLFKSQVKYYFICEKPNKKEENDMQDVKKEVFETAGTGDNPSDFAKDAVKWAKEKRIFAGDGNGNYGWQKAVTREQMAYILYTFFRNKI